MVEILICFTIPCSFLMDSFDIQVELYFIIMTLICQNIASGCKIID